MNRLLIVSALLLSGCAAKPVLLQPGAESVRIGKNDPEPGFVYVGEVSGASGNGCWLYGSQGSFGESAKALRNEAFALGADYVQIMSETRPGLRGTTEAGCYQNTYRIDGTAYKASSR